MLSSALKCTKKENSTMKKNKNLLKHLNLQWQQQDYVQARPEVHSRLRQKAATYWHSTYQGGRDVLTPGQSLNSDGKCRRSFNSHIAHGNSFFNISSKKALHPQKRNVIAVLHQQNIHIVPCPVLGNGPGVLLPGVCSPGCRMCGAEPIAEGI